MIKISIIGAGAIGTSIGNILSAKKEIQISFWDRDALKVAHQKNISEVSRESDFLFLCVPSWCVREAVSSVSSFLSPKTIVVCLAKGIETDSHKTMDQVLAELLPEDQKFAIFGGPFLAKELDIGMIGVGAMGAAHKEISDDIARLFAGTHAKIEFAGSARAVALSGVIKNIYALALGIFDGLNFGQDAKGWLAAKSVKEMSSILESLGQDKSTAYSSAGLGDLLATGYSPYSKNHQAGEKIAKNGSLGVKSEGIVALSSIIFLLNGRQDKMPILSALEDVVIKNADPKIVFKDLLA